MSYLQDTNAWITYLNPAPSPLKDRFRAHPVDAIAVSSVVKAELLYGAQRSAQSHENLELIRRLFAVFPGAPFDDSAAESYGQLRAVLAARGQLIGPNDLLIAATALSRNLILVTHNLREFTRVDGLKLDDWEAEAH